MRYLKIFEDFISSNQEEGADQIVKKSIDFFG